MLVVHVVVAETVLDAEATEHGLEAGCVADGGGLVAGGIGLGDAHVSLGVHGVIEAPVGYRADGHAVLERLAGILFQCFERHETSVTPAPNGKVVFVHVGFLGPYFCGLNLVMGFPKAEIASDDRSGGAADVAGSSAIDCDHDIA